MDESPKNVKNKKAKGLNVKNTKVFLNQNGYNTTNTNGDVNTDSRIPT